MTLLGVNIDHVATVRQARRAETPSVVEAARAAVRGGADSITVHLREDRRHIQDADVAALKRTLEGAGAGTSKVRLNLEMAATEEMVRIARVVRPSSVCLVPEKRQELTTEGGLDAAGQLKKLKAAADKVKAKGVTVSFFVDPDPVQVEAAKAAGADAVELHTGAYAAAADGTETQHDALRRLQLAAVRAKELGLTLNAGHGLDYANVAPIARIVGMNELNIGFSIVARAVFAGLEEAVREMKRLLA